MGKTRDLFKKMRDTKELFMKRWANKGQKWQGRKKVEEIKKRWQEYPEELHKKGLTDLDNHNDVITHQSQTSWSVKSSGP